MFDCFVCYRDPWIWQPPPLTGARFKAQLRLLHLTTHNYHHDTTTHVTLLVLLKTLLVEDCQQQNAI